jgi:hypothetical protein
MSHSTDNDVGELQLVEEATLLSNELQKQLIEPASLSLSDTLAPMASDPVEAPSVLILGEEMSMTSLNSDLKANVLMDEAIEAGNELVKEEAEKLPSIEDVMEHVHDSTIVNIVVVNTLCSEVSEETPLVAKMVVELQDTSPTCASPRSNPDSPTPTASSYDDPIPISTSPNPIIPSVDAAPEAGPETATSSIVLHTDLPEPPLSPSSDNYLNINPISATSPVTDCTESEQISMTPVHNSESSLTSPSNSSPSTTSDIHTPSSHTNSEECGTIDTSITTTTTEVTPNDAKSPETLHVASTSSSSTVITPVQSPDVDASQTITENDEKMTTTTANESETTARKNPPVASSSAPDLRSSAVDRVAATSKDKPAVRTMSLSAPLLHTPRTDSIWSLLENSSLTFCLTFYLHPPPLQNNQTNSLCLHMLVQWAVV